MATDVFNNPSNDYINPGLAPCSGTSDSYTFEFLPRKEAGIVSGSDILQVMDLSDIEIDITTWNQEKKTLQSGEVIYVPGLTRGLLHRTQVFDIDYNSGEATAPYFMILDISINFYNNFRYYDINIEASANYATTTSIQDAMNVALAAAGVSATMTYDASSLSFAGNTEGYDFDITNTVLTLIDSSTGLAELGSAYVNFDFPFLYPPSLPTYTLVEDTTSELPASKYPNGGSLGYLLKVIYPSTATASNKWVYLNNVYSPYVVYDNLTLALDPEAGIYYDPTISLGTQPTVDASTVEQNIDSSILSGEVVIDGSVSWSTFTDSSLSLSIIWDSSLSTTYVGDSSIYTTVGQNRPTIDQATIWNSYIYNSVITDSSIYGGNVVDSSLVNCTTYNVNMLRSTDVNSRTVEIDASGYITTTDSSLYYERFSKKVDVGMSGAGTSTILSAAEYLDYVNSNDLWDKVGWFMSQISDVDPVATTQKNLVGGFYLFNPHTFDVLVEYMLIN